MNKLSQTSADSSLAHALQMAAGEDRFHEQRELSVSYITSTSWNGIVKDSNMRQSLRAVSGLLIAMALAFSMSLAQDGGDAGSTDIGTADSGITEPCSILTAEQIEVVVGRPVIGTRADGLGEAGTALGRCTWTIAAPDFPPIEGEVIIEFYGDGQETFDTQMQLFTTWYEPTEVASV